MHTYYIHTTYIHLHTFKSVEKYVYLGPRFHTYIYIHIHTYIQILTQNSKDLLFLSAKVGNAFDLEKLWSLWCWSGRWYR